MHFHMILAICIIQIFICTTRKDGFKCLHFPMFSQQEQPTYPIFPFITHQRMFFLYLSQKGWDPRESPAHTSENVQIHRTLRLSSQILIYFIVDQKFKQEGSDSRRKKPKSNLTDYNPNALLDNNFVAGGWTPNFNVHQKWALN